MDHLDFLSFPRQKDNADEDLYQTAADEWLDYDSDDDHEEAADDKGRKPPKDEDPLYNDIGDDADAQWVEAELLAHMGKGAKRSDAVLNCPCCFALLSIDCQRHETYVNQFRAMFVRNCKVYRDRELRYRRQDPAQLSNRQRKKLHARQSRLAKKQKKAAQQSAGQAPMDDDGDDDDDADESANQAPHGLRPYELVDNIMVEDEPQFYSEIYLPVHCARCDTEVGVFESDVYHFYHTVPTDI
eukprot:TRINITY_DN27062_c0_g1_i1.p1 TRINITY_DN27062_c0_g1~~TRINITY_DN27062_c0_g1_i1.p1  ORF type:complete len:242 (+),score=45.21 TRINITY_DN27062_c0_g1_i1:63-788(+)